MPAAVPRLVTGMTRVRVCPCRVKVPVTSSLPLATSFTAVLLKVMVGNFATSKKSELRRCLSRASLPVSMLAASMTTSTEEREMSSGSTWMVPWNVLKRPAVLLSRWRILKLTSEWVASMR
jgi:hypothetical protein